MAKDEEKDLIAALAADKRRMDQYSRQIGDYGMAAMAKLVNMKVLVVGLKGVGIEAAKNLILAGVGAVTLYDDDEVLLRDLGTNFYLRPDQVGKPNLSRAEASLDALKSLNPLVKVSVLTGNLTNKHIKNFTVVLDCALTLEEAIICDKSCRKAKVKYIRAAVHGLCGYIFNDFGKSFDILDKTGEAVVTRLIDGITIQEKSSKSDDNKNTTKELVVRIIADKQHNIQFDGHVNFINFEEVEGELGEILNAGKGKDAFEVSENSRVRVERKDGKVTEKQVFDPYSLKVSVKNLDANLIKLVEEYNGGGRILQVKKPVKASHQSLEKNTKTPVMPMELMFMDGVKFGRREQLHLAMLGLWEYEKSHGELPPANSEKAVKEVQDSVLRINKEHQAANKSNKSSESVDLITVDEVDEKVVETLVNFAECSFQPLCCFFGGIVAQEVVKHTGKYTPLDQWMYHDCFELLPEAYREHEVKVSKEDREPIGSRYDDLIKIIGLSLHKKLMKSSTFMVGCGALGCELLKNFALIGLACDESKEGTITVTDNDNIEVSNLSRQFLFREHNVRQPKSIAAGVSVREMNPNVNVKSLEMLVSPDSESTFNAEFWRSQDFITNALDNVTARLYVDSKCVLFEKPLLESGTLGTKCNSQVILPFLTATYGEGPKGDEGDAIPMCTLRNFPSEVNHCIEWARAGFTDHFETDSTKASKYLQDPEAFVKELRAKTLDLADKGAILSAVSSEIKSLKSVYNILMAAKSSETNFEFCVKEAYELFHRLFRDKIHSLISQYPKDSKDKDGNPFWNQKKRFPQAASFDTNNESHVNFVLSTANILSLIYGVVATQAEFVEDAEIVKKIAAGIKPPTVQMEKVVLEEDATEETPATKAVDESEAQVETFETLLKDLEELATSSEIKGIKVEPTSFEKDDDANGHIDYITASTNLRAWNYRLEQSSRHKCKMIAGKIIPAIATTTAAVTGLITIELLKIIQTGKKLEAFKDSSNSLGVNQYVFMEPGQPEKAKDEYDVMTLEDVVCLPSGFTSWDKTKIQGKDLTLKQFLDEFTSFAAKNYSKEKVRLGSLYHPNANHKGRKGFSKMLYDEDSKEGMDSMDKDLKQMLADLYGPEVVAGDFVHLECTALDADEQGYKVAYLMYEFS